ncbi:hypothetical protein AU106_gp077 [Sinorhizobium phage phiM9]|uniref:Uncharacterized protein n=1 Tax=Sinorhizobium phage phiM9 TaxID=1636182 RepID=A0A0F6R7F5_9CAUD|nr:hypothetical protein AU106_gp077 [Sinorhizobium phage phiM9]AKE44708.1 hypothetical protein Sm_phiM9_078 [Sinorhizobium phage phiM9]
MTRVLAKFNGIECVIIGFYPTTAGVLAIVAGPWKDRDIDTFHLEELDVDVDKLVKEAKKAG